MKYGYQRRHLTALLLNSWLRHIYCKIAQFYVHKTPRNINKAIIKEIMVDFDDSLFERGIWPNDRLIGCSKQSLVRISYERSHESRYPSDDFVERRKLQLSAGFLCKIPCGHWAAWAPRVVWRVSSSSYFCLRFPAHMESQKLTLDSCH